MGTLNAVGIATDAEPPDSGTGGARALAAAVLTQAWDDAQMAEATADRRQARLFLLAPSGGWARSRVRWCERAGIEPEALTAAVRRKLLAAIGAEQVAA